MLEINNLSVSYGPKEVLKSLNFTAQEASIHGIMGHNGAGKTTLFNTLYGRIIPQNGQISWQGKNTAREHISYMETYTFFYPYMLGKEYLQLIKNEKDKIAHWAKIFDLPLDQRVDKYSTGMKKKIALIAQLLLDRPILLLDEPFSGVDIESNEKINLILQRLQSTGKTILIASHSIHQLIHVCDRISVLEDGQFQDTYEKTAFPALQTYFKDRIKEELEGL